MKRPDMKLLREMLTYKRPARSATEIEFIERFLRPLPGLLEDDYGNLYVDLLHSDGGQSSTLFSCHTDTVHPGCGLAGGRHQVVSCGKTMPGWVTAEGKTQLGADDAVGIWLMLHMLDNGVPGLYVFHRDEEIGGIGSQHAVGVLTRSGRLDTIKRAIAFDRRGTQDIITHQSGGRCCSDKFAQTLAYALGMDHKPDPSGVFTDTANYTDIVAECTNISAGYEREHTFDERVNLTYVENLANAVVHLDWENLPTERTPGDNDLLDFAYTGWSYNTRRKTKKQRLRELELIVANTRPEQLASALFNHLGLDADDLETALFYCA